MFGGGFHDVEGSVDQKLKGQTGFLDALGNADGCLVEDDVAPGGEIMHQIAVANVAFNQFGASVSQCRHKIRVTSAREVVRTLTWATRSSSN